MKGVLQMVENDEFGLPKGKTVEYASLKTIEIPRRRFEQLLHKEAHIDFVRKWLASKVTYNNYTDISDLLLLLDIKKGEKNE